MNGPAQGLCLPTDEVVLVEAIRKFVAEALDQPVQSIGIDDDFYDVLGLDSIGTVAVFVDLAYEFGVPEPTDKTDFEKFRSVRALAEYARRAETGAPALEP